MTPPAPRSNTRKAAAKKAAARGGGPAQERELRAQGRKTMRKLLEAGMTVFARRGYHAARVDDIVKVARTSHGTFYLYFSNKEDLFRALVADVAEELRELSESLGQIGPDEKGYAELRDWLARFTDIYGRYGPVIRAWTEAETEESDIGRTGGDVLAGFTRAITDRLQAAGGDRPFNDQVAALALVAMIERFHYYVQSRRIEVDRDDVLETLTSIIHVGLFRGTPRR